MAKATIANRVWMAVGLLVIWVSISSAGIVPASVLPSPQATCSALARHLVDGTLVAAVMASLTRLAIGYAIAAVVGVLLGIVMTMIGPWNLGITPLLAALLAIPSVAYVPLSIVWFGPTNVAVVAVVALVASPPIATGTMRGLTAVPLRYKQAAKVLGASGFFYLRTIVMPSAGPNLIAGAQQGWTFAWRALVSGELLIKGGIGLGRSLETARASDDLATVFAVLAVIAFFSLALDTFLRRMAEN